MIKNLLLLTISTSFVAILLIANSTIALAWADFPAQNPPVSILNAASPSLHSLGDRILPNHLGCSCSLCTQVAKSNTNSIL